MSTLDRFSSIHLAASAATGADGGQVVPILIVIGVLVLTAGLMMKAVGPFIEIFMQAFRALLAAVLGFALIAIAIFVLLVALVPR